MTDPKQMTDAELADHNDRNAAMFRILGKEALAEASAETARRLRSCPECKGTWVAGRTTQYPCPLCKPELHEGSSLAEEVADRRDLGIVNGHLVAYVPRPSSDVDPNEQDPGTVPGDAT